MSSPDLISLLEDLIMKHPRLKEEDKAVVKKICTLLRIEELGDINAYHRLQVEAEAGVVYLKSKYGSICSKCQSVVDKHRSVKFLELGSRDSEGLKWTKAGKCEWLLSTDAKYSVLLDLLEEVEELNAVLRELSHIVFSRDRKLEQLSINYRREAEADRRTAS